MGFEVLMVVGESGELRRVVCLFLLGLMFVFGLVGDEDVERVFGWVGVDVQQLFWIVGVVVE